MRIIGGLWRRRRLLVPAGHDIRPTADRTRESLFSILENSGNYACWPLADATVLDIFAGTGALGLEALSRGAKQAVFIDDNATSIATVNHNLETIKCHAFGERVFCKFNVPALGIKHPPKTAQFLRNNCFVANTFFNKHLDLALSLV